MIHWLESGNKKKRFDRFEGWLYESIRMYMKQRIDGFNVL